MTPPTLAQVLATWGKPQPPKPKFDLAAAFCAAVPAATPTLAAVAA